MDEQVDRRAEDFNPLNPELRANPDLLFEVNRELREQCPVKKSGSGWFLTRYSDNSEVFRRNDDFSSAMVGPGGVVSDGAHVPTHDTELDDLDVDTLMSMLIRIPIGIDPPEFNRYRSLLNPFFTGARAARRAPETREIANRLIDEFIETGECEFHEQLCRPLPGILTCRVVGVPEEHWEAFADPVQLVARPESSEMYGASSAASVDRVATASGSLMGPLLQVAENERDQERDNLASMLVHATVDDGRRLNHYEIAGILSTVLAGGVETTTAAIGTGLVYLGRHPEVRQRLVDDPSLIPDACEEMLRMWPPLPMFTRTAKRACTIDGNQVEKGDTISLSLAGANRDPEQFPDPEEFVVDRQPNRHMTFTVGIHRCIGSHLARMEMHVAFEEILRRVPDYELVEDGVVLAPSGGIYAYDSIRATFAPGERELG